MTNKAMLCLDFGGTKIKIAVVRDGEILTKGELAPVARIEELELLARLAEDLLVDTQLDAVGIALPGIVDRRSGLLLSAGGKYEFARTFSILDWVRQQFNVPAAIELDSRAALLGETRYGVAKGENNVAVLVLGTGTGTAVLLDGAVLRGNSGHAGVLGGHLPITVDGEPCVCGSHGCLESEGSGWALAKWPHAAAPLDLPSLLRLKDDGDALAERYWHRLMTAWAMTTVDLIQNFDPAVVVLTGGMMRAAERILPELRPKIEPRLWPSLAMPALRVAAKPESSVLLGLNVLAAEALSSSAAIEGEGQ